MRYIRTILFIFTIGLLLAGCEQPVKTDAPERKKIVRTRKKPKKQTYHVEKARQWIKGQDTASHTPQQHIIATVNRMDMAHIAKMDTILVPDDLSGDIEYYLSFPMDIPSLQDIDKIIFFSYPTQSFGAYEYGQLAYAGPTNMGRKKDPTPTGLYYTNWKAEATTSTFNDEWDLKWNFNIENKQGIGWHQYDLPGYPASHSCLRLLEEDAKRLYRWADEWKLAGANSIKAYGTPVIVFGEYTFDDPKPWWQLLNDPDALDIDATTIGDLVKPHLTEIISRQKTREALRNRK